MVQPTDNLAAMLTTAAPGTTFVLMQGTKYTADATIILPNNASFTIWGQSGPDRPILAFNGITLPTTAGSIKFENLDITGYQNGIPPTKRQYLFNQGTPNTTSEVIFENCKVRNFANTPFRLKDITTITIDKLTFNNCIVYDINGSYAFIHNTVASKINNISLTNNTFYSIGYSVILNNAAPSQTVQVDNNTFYNVAGDGRYIIDYNTQQVTSSFTFTNNVIGKTASPAGTARDLRAGTGTSVTIGNNTYKTSDAVFFGTPIPNIIAYPKTSIELFTDPASGNFLFQDLAFPGRSTSGDPRWRY
jgi:hypothetical protein